MLFLRLVNPLFPCPHGNQFYRGSHRGKTLFRRKKGFPHISPVGSVGASACGRGVHRTPRTPFLKPLTLTLRRMNGSAHPMPQIEYRQIGSAFFDRYIFCKAKQHTAAAWYGSALLFYIDSAVLASAVLTVRSNTASSATYHSCRSGWHIPPVSTFFRSD